MESQVLANRDEPVSLFPAVAHASMLAKETGIEPNHEAKVDVNTGGFPDRLFNLLIQQVTPQRDAAEIHGNSQEGPQALDRPSFSLPLMSTNFRRFNARIGVVFVFQNRLLRLFSWRAPTQTLSFLAVYTLCCLHPSLLLCSPILASILFVMVPAYLSRHPPPPDALPTETFAMQGPASAPPSSITPAPEMSKDFFRNMRDLQNCMEDFSVIHDRILAFIAPLTNFSNEKTSSTVFLMLLLIGTALFTCAGFIPWRIVVLLCGWVVICILHPSSIKVINALDKAALTKKATSASTRVWNSAQADVILDEAPETRQVEIFELQRHGSTDEWRPWMFSVSPYDPMSPRRISGERPRGARFFEDVEPPRGWYWKDKKWSLDLSSSDWVEQRMITSVELETEDERWVYDAASSDEIEEPKSASMLRRARGLDDGVSNSQSHRGEWRRRRWIRLVQRRVLP